MAPSFITGPAPDELLATELARLDRKLDVADADRGLPSSVEEWC